MNEHVVARILLVLLGASLVVNAVGFFFWRALYRAFKPENVPLLLKILGRALLRGRTITWDMSGDPHDVARPEPFPVSSDLLSLLVGVRLFILSGGRVAPDLDSATQLLERVIAELPLEKDQLEILASEPMPASSAPPQSEPDERLAALSRLEDDLLPTLLAARFVVATRGQDPQYMEALDARSEELAIAAHLDEHPLLADKLRTKRAACSVVDLAARRAELERLEKEDPPPPCG